MSPNQILAKPPVVLLMPLVTINYARSGPTVYCVYCPQAAHYIINCEQSAGDPELAH